MSLKVINVLSSAVLLHTPGQVAESDEIINTGGFTAFISNNSGVTTTTGFPLTPGSRIKWFGGFVPGGSVYGICASGASTQVTVGTAVS